MTSEAKGYGVVSRVRAAVSARLAAMVLVGVLAGYSVAALGKDAVALPVVGDAPGLAVGAVGLAVAAVAFRRIGSCGECGCRTVGLSGGCNCEDSCSVDP